MYSGRIWLGSVALSGVLLLSSMPGLGSVPTAAAQTGGALSFALPLTGTQAPIVSKQLGFTARRPGFPFPVLLILSLTAGLP